MLDLFCGVGNFTLPIATLAKSVIGIELDMKMVQRASLNARKNGITNAEFIAADLITGKNMIEMLSHKVFFCSFLCFI